MKINEIIRVSGDAIRAFHHDHKRSLLSPSRTEVVCVNFTHLNITPSTLYLIAAPSTPKEVREEVLERASNGENIGYTKAKAIVCKYRKTKKGAAEPKTASLKPDEPVKVIELTDYEITSAISAQEDLTEKEAQTET